MSLHKTKNRSTGTNRSKTKRTSKKLPLHKHLLRHLTQRGFAKPKVVPALVAVIFAGIGSYLLVFSKAATPAKPAYSYFALQTSSGLHKTANDANWVFAAGNFDGDGKPDMYAIQKSGGSNSTEVHILGSSSNYKNFILQTGTPLHPTVGDNYWFDVADYDGDKRDDLYLIKKNGQSTTEVHILSAASNFQTWVAHSITSLHKTDADPNWRFKIGDFDGDGRGDLYAIQTQGSNYRTDIHVMAAKDNFQKFALQSNSALHDTAHDAANWDFDVGDYDADRRSDVIAIKKNGTSSTEIHVLIAANNFNSFRLQTGTGLHKTTTDPNWNFTTGDFDRDGDFDLFAIQKNGVSSTEVHILGSKYIAAVNDPAPTTNTSAPSAPAQTPGATTPAPTNNTSGSPAPSTGSTSPSSPAGTDCSRTYLVQGNIGNCVVVAQYILTAKGFNPGVADGVYGANTAAAVVRLKTQYKISPCSVGSSINTQVWDVLYDRYIPAYGSSCTASTAPVSAPAPPSATATGTTNLPKPSVYHGDGSDSKTISIDMGAFVGDVLVKVCVSIAPKSTTASALNSVNVTNGIKTQPINIVPTTINGKSAFSGCTSFTQSTTITRTYSVNQPGYWVNVYEGK